MVSFRTGTEVRRNFLGTDTGWGPRRSRCVDTRGDTPLQGKGIIYFNHFEIQMLWQNQRSSQLFLIRKAYHEQITTPIKNLFVVDDAYGYKMASMDSKLLLQLSLIEIITS